MKKILIVAGDPSGDLIASKLVIAMRRLQPDLQVTGVGGANLKKVCDRFLADIVGQHALGFAISPRTIFHFRKVLNEIIAPEIRNNQPDAVIPVDFYGFNSRVAKLAKSLNRKVFYYVSPQFWASRPGRAQRLQPFVDLFLCLFPFEIDFYRKKNIPAQFVGHPLVDAIPEILSGDHRQRVESNIGLLPGSRPDEIRRHLPVMRDACRLIKKEHPSCRFILFTVPHVDRDLYKDILVRDQEEPLLVDMVQDENYQWRSQLDLAITASGMETFENTLLGIPMVVMYKMNWFTFLLARMVISTPYVALPNVLSKAQLVPELIQGRATPSALAKPIVQWLANPQERLRVRAELLSLRNLFGQSGAVDRAARTILEKVA